jgi:hypothetical protein
MTMNNAVFWDVAPCRSFLNRRHIQEDSKLRLFIYFRFVEVANDMKL